MRNKVVYTIARVLLGLILVVFGLNYFLQFIPMGEMPENIAAVMAGFTTAGYLLPTVKVIEIVVGLMMLTNKYVKLGAILLAPLSVNFLLFHIVLAPATGMLAYVVVLINVYLGWYHFDSYRPLFK